MLGFDENACFGGDLAIAHQRSTVSSAETFVKNMKSSERRRSSQRRVAYARVLDAARGNCSHHVLIAALY